MQHISNTDTEAQKQSTQKQQPKQDDLDSWVCVLCCKICHYRGLGDLYGPYNIDFSSQQTTNKIGKSVTPKKSKYSLLNHNYAFKEVWIHEDCLVWSEGVRLIGRRIISMEDVIKASLHNNCSSCKKKGATLGCIGKRCRRKYHYTCARDANCFLDETNFSLKCDKCLANTAANRSFSINF